MVHDPLPAAPSGAGHVVLHDHLDGGVRPATLFELCRSGGITLPDGVRDEAGLAEWSVIRPTLTLPEAFARFDLPIAVMRTADGLRRVAREAAEDLVADGVVEAELRFAPTQHLGAGLSIDEVVAAVVDGLADGGLTPRVLLCAMRTERRTSEVVDVAGRWIGRGVVGVDLAGVEIGEPVGPHRAEFARARSLGLGVTLHAGEMVGAASVAETMDGFVPDRIGHGYRLIEDCRVDDGRIVDLGPIAQRVHDARLPLEMCLSSNALTGMPIEQHPFLTMHRAGFVITLNTDNRVLIGCSMSSELELARRCGATDTELAQMRANAHAALFPAAVV